MRVIFLARRRAASATSLAGGMSIPSRSHARVMHARVPGAAEVLDAPLARSSSTIHAGSAGMRFVHSLDAPLGVVHHASRTSFDRTLQRVVHALSAVRRSRGLARSSSALDAASCRRRVAGRSKPSPSAMTAQTPGQRTACSIAQSRRPALSSASTNSERSTSRASGHSGGHGAPNIARAPTRNPRTSICGRGHTARPTHAT